MKRREAEAQTTSLDATSDVFSACTVLKDGSTTNPNADSTAEQRPQHVRYRELSVLLAGTFRCRRKCCRTYAIHRPEHAGRKARTWKAQRYTSCPAGLNVAKLKHNGDFQHRAGRQKYANKNVLPRNGSVPAGAVVLPGEIIRDTEFD